MTCRTKNQTNYELLKLRKSLINNLLDPVFFYTVKYKIVFLTITMFANMTLRIF